MVRKNKEFKKADKILTGDWHIQETSPVCRIDDFWNTAWGKIQFISELQKKHNCPIFHSGDLFDNWKPSPMLLSKAIENLPPRFCTIYGNHDLPQHSLDLVHKCGVHTLEKAGVVTVLNGVHWGESPERPSWRGYINEFTERKILVWHTMTYQGRKPYPGCSDPKASRLLKKYKDYDLILTGHNHIPFIEEYQGRLLVNPGSIFRTSAAQVEHTPRVYLWYADTNTVEPVYLPIEKSAISRAHLEDGERRDERLEAFISSVQDYKSHTSFKDNLEAYKKKNKIRKPVMDIIYKSIDNETH